MKNTATRLRSLCAALAALVLLLALAVPAFAADGFADLYYRMNDSAEVLTEDEDNELEASLEELSVRQSFDVVVATIDSLEDEGYTSMEEYADDLYDYCQFGYGENRDGVLLLVSIGDRKWHISTCGYGITAFTDAGIQYLGEQMTPFMADGDYAGAFRTFVQWSDTYIDAARAGHPYDVNNLPREPLSLIYLFLALGIGLQNIPEGAAVSLPLMQAGQGRRKAFCAGAASGLVEPLGALLALALAGWVSAALPWLMSAAAGCMVCVTAQEMIPEAVEQDEPAGVISVVLGFALMMALDIAL